MAKIVIKNAEQLKEFLAFAEENRLSEADLFADDGEEQNQEDNSGGNEAAPNNNQPGNEQNASDNSNNNSEPSQNGNNGNNNNIDTDKVAMSEPDGADLKKGSITMDMVVTKLNQLRSGRSLKDQNIAAEMDKYFGDLNDNERLALYAFLKGITQIITGEISGEKATEPEDTNQIDIKGRAAPGESKTLKVPVVHKGGPNTPQKINPSKEDTTAPTPVQAKRRG